MTYLASLKSSLRRDFVKNAAILISGTAAAQVITFITAPFLTRIYSPESYGLLAIYITVTTIIGTISTLQYNNVILTSKDEREAEQAIVLCIFLSAVFAVFLLFGVFLFGEAIGRWLKNPAMERWLYLGPLSIFFSGLNTAFTYYANRLGKYKLLSLNRIITASMIPVVSIGIGLLIPGALGLFLGLLLGQIVPAILLSNFFLNNQKLQLSFSFSSIRLLLSKYKSFPIYTLPTEFINNVINQIPVLLLGRYFNTAIVGYYNLSGRILGIPIQLVSSSVGDVFRQRAAEEYNTQGNSYQIFKKTFWSTFLISLVPFSMLLFASPWLFSFVFGEKWREAGLITQILVPLFLLRFTVSPLSYMFIIAGRQREDMIVHLIMLTLIIAVFILARQYNRGYRETIGYYSAVYATTYLYYLLRSFQFAKNNNRVGSHYE